MKKTCGNCIYFGFEAKTPDQGHCLVAPPQLVMAPQQSALQGRANLNVMGLSPPTIAARPGCREHIFTQESLADLRNKQIENIKVFKTDWHK